MAGRFFVLLVAACVLAAGCAQKGAQTAESGAAAPGAAAGNTGRGGQVFRNNCSVCHGTNGASGIGPSLDHESKRRNYQETVAWIKQPEPPMPKLYPSPLSEKDVQDVAAYVQSL